MQRTGLVLGLLVIIVLAAGALAIRSGGHGAADSGTVAASGNGKTVTVTLTSNGFSPETILITQGDTVKFVSTTGSFFWPASNPHPTHTIYPAFDPQQPIAPKDSWSFTFERVGTWHYHDHLAPYFTGTVIVASSSASGT